MPRKREQIRIEMVISESADKVDPEQAAEEIVKLLTDDRVQKWADEVQSVLAEVRNRTPIPVNPEDDSPRGQLSLPLE